MPKPPLCYRRRPALLALGLALTVVSGCAGLPFGLSLALKPGIRPPTPAESTAAGVAAGGAPLKTDAHADTPHAGPGQDGSLGPTTGDPQTHPVVLLTAAPDAGSTVTNVQLVPSILASGATPVPTPTPAPPTGTDMRLPSGVAVTRGGDIYVTDRSRQQVLRYSASGSARVIAGTGVADYGGEGVSALQAPLSNPHAARLDAAGNLFLIERNPALAALDKLEDTGRADNLCLATRTPLSRVRRIGTDGTVTTVYAADRQLILDLVVTPEGVLYMAQWDPCGGKSSVITTTPGGAGPSVVIDTGRGATLIDSLCYDQDHNLYANADKQLLEYTEHAIATVYLPSAIQMPTRPADAAVLNVWGGGEIYVCESAPARIVRWTPFIGVVEVVAGVGAKNYGGTGADDSLAAPCYPTFGPDGSLYFIDNGHHVMCHLTPTQLAQSTRI